MPARVAACTPARPTKWPRRRGFSPAGAPNASCAMPSTAPASGDTGGSNEEWAYLFFVEVSGHTTDRPLVSAFEDVRHKTRFFKVLGSYPSI